MIHRRAGDVMHIPTVSSFRATFSDLPRRVNHGGAAWLRRRNENLLQPQDGTSAADALLADLQSKSRTASLEAQDALLTGGTRSLVRRLTGLNVAEPGQAAHGTARGELRRVLAKRPAVA